MTTTYYINGSNVAGASASRGYNRQMGTVAGTEMPTLIHNKFVVPGHPGSVFVGAEIDERVIVMTWVVWGKTHDDLLLARRSLFAILNFHDGQQTYDGLRNPIKYTLTIEGDAETVAIDVVYETMVATRQPAQGGLLETIAVRFIANDPLFYNPTQSAEEAVLHNTETDNSFFMRKLGGTYSYGWDNPCASAAGGNKDVFAICETNRYIHIGGDFTDFNGDSGSDYYARFDKFDGGQESVSTGANGIIYQIKRGPDGYIYIVGAFTTLGGTSINRIARVHPRYKDSNLMVYAEEYASGANGTVRAIAWDSFGRMYVAGEFTQVGGATAAARIAYYEDGSWSAMDTGLDNTVHDIDVGRDDELFAVGAFTDSGRTRFGSWKRRNGSWSVTLGTATFGNNALLAVKVAKNGDVYVGGTVTAIASDSDWDYHAVLKGNSWYPLAGDDDRPIDEVYDIDIDVWGNVYFAGNPNTSIEDGKIRSYSGLAKFNGTEFVPVGLKAVSGSIGCRCVLCGHWGDDDSWMDSRPTDLFIGTTGSGNSVYFPQNITARTLGSYELYPTIKVYNKCVLRMLENHTTGQSIDMVVPVRDNEVITLDLSPGTKSIESSWAGEIFDLVFPQSDFDTFKLLAGYNYLSLSAEDTAVRENNDGSNQLSDWEDITGIDLSTTWNGTIFVEIVDDGGGYFHIDIYNDPLKTSGDLVGHTATYNTTGAKAIVEDNSSGLGGTITVDAVTAADSDINVVYTLLEISWHDKFLSADEGVS